MKMMKKIALFCVTGIILTQGATAWAGNAANGKRIYGEDPKACLECHATPKLFMRDDKKAKNLANLETWVRRCAVKAETKWFDSEVRDVVAYLNQAYYHY